MLKKIKPYVISIGIALAVGGLSALLTQNNMDIYNEIIKPPLAPPGFLFPIVWTVLYVLMGISSARVWVKDKESSKGVLFIYALSLVVNFFWSIIFFNMRMFLSSFIWLILLWVLIILTIKGYLKISKFAGILQIPYLLWVTFAGYLNLMIYILNR
ncbi:MAG: tryptophan-rich sensory protein [Oscillospiraceae bacterium]|nr:tryptophan-rich sensory protein [Oscillospiraceae bacterium]